MLWWFIEENMESQTLLLWALVNRGYSLHVWSFIGFCVYSGESWQWSLVLVLRWVSQTFLMMLLKGKEVECKFPFRPFWSPFCFKLRLCMGREQTVQNDCQVIGGRTPAVLPMMSSERILSGSWTKTWANSVQFFSLREWEVFLWMFIFLYNRKPIFPSGIAGMLSVLDWAQTPSMWCGGLGFATSQVWGINSSCS